MRIPPFGRRSIAAQRHAMPRFSGAAHAPVFQRGCEEGYSCGRKNGDHHLRVTPHANAKSASGHTQELGLTVTDYLCLCGLGKQIVRVDGLDPIRSELKAQGRNLNQLTTLANMGKVTVVYGDKLAESYQQISEQLRQLLREVT